MVPEIQSRRANIHRHELQRESHVNKGQLIAHSFKSLKLGDQNVQISFLNILTSLSMVRDEFLGLTSTAFTSRHVKDECLNHADLLTMKFARTHSFCEPIVYIEIRTHHSRVNAVSGKL